VTRHINAAGLALIKEFEGCRLDAYKDAVGVLTIGYGSTGPHVHSGDHITPQEAEALLQSDLGRFEQAVEQAALKPTDNQFAAMVALSFNIGISALLRSTVLREHNAGHYQAAAEAFKLWNKAGGRELAGLTRRRAAEADLYRKAA
jgi:lysozyme